MAINDRRWGLRGVTLAALLFCGQLVSIPTAKALDTSRAQSEMYSRINASVDAFADRLGVKADLVSYCRTELNLHTMNHPANGLIPYGVNYNTIDSQSHLDHVIRVREAHEHNYLLLCLARAKRDLDAAKE